MTEFIKKAEVNQYGEPITQEDYWGKRKKSILVVEDDHTHRVLMEKTLNECEFEVFSAENGLAALTLIDSGKEFDLILMDWDMPEMNGLETSMAIRKREISDRSRHKPIIAFTSNRNTGDREKCIAAGMDAYLPKEVWMPKWRELLINNLQGLIAGNFDIHDFDDDKMEKKADDASIEAYDFDVLEQTIFLLKDEFEIAVDEYLEDAAAYIKEIRQGIISNNSEKTAKASHPLKSNSEGFGLKAVAQLAREINSKSRNGQMDGLDILSERLQEVFYQGEKMLRQEIQKRIYS